VSTILLASADGELRRLAAAELAKGGHQGLFSPDPVEAVRLLAAGGVAAAIVDLELPEPGGEALIARIRAEDSGRELPVLAVLRRGAEPGSASGADHWLARPLGKMAVAEAVLKLVTVGQGPRLPAAGAVAASGQDSAEAARLCHALNGPLSVISGHLDAIRSRHRDLPEDLQRRLQEMSLAVARIAELIGAGAGQGRGRA